MADSQHSQSPSFHRRHVGGPCRKPEVGRMTPIFAGAVREKARADNRAELTTAADVAGDEMTAIENVAIGHVNLPEGRFKSLAGILSNGSSPV